MPNPEFVSSVMNQVMTLYIVKLLDYIGVIVEKIFSTGWILNAISGITQSVLDNSE